MSNTFEFVGKISAMKETEKFKPIDRKTFDSKWQSLTVKFSCISDTNRIMLTAQGGKWEDDKKNIVKTFSKTTTDKNGNVVKGTNIEIPWAKRFDQAEIDKVAGFKKFYVDTCDNRSLRYQLREAVNNNNITDELLEQIGVDSEEEAKAALEKMENKYRVFLSEWDFCEYIIRVLNSDRVKDKLFKFSGTYDIQHNASKGTFYRNYRVNRITMVDDNTEFATDMKLDVYFGNDAWDDSSYDETGKIHVNGWTDYYDSTFKKKGFDELHLVIREDDEKKINLLKKRFSSDGSEINKIGVVVSVLDGAERAELTVDMLSEDDREEYEAGLTTWADLRKKYGATVMGDRVRELRFKKLDPENKLQDTAFTLDDMHAARADEVKEEDLPFDLFDDDEEI